MQGTSFWDRYAQQRLSRRRALQLAAVGTGGLAFAAACGGGEEGAETPTAGAPTAPAEGQPKAGGVLHGTVSLVLGYDPIKATTFLTHALASYCYSRLVRYRTVVGELPQEDWYGVQSELASEWENPDDTTFIFTLHPEATWHPVAPVNGRKVTASDIVYAWELYQSLSPNRNNLGSVVEAVEASADDTQVTFKLKQPFGLFLNRLASFQDLWIMPRELIETDGDGEKRMVGSGPFMLDPSSQRDRSLIYKKNPNYWEKDGNGNQLPYLDGVELAVLPDVNQVLTQFAAGNLDTIAVPPQLLNAFRNENPSAIVDLALRNILNFFYFEAATYTANKPPFNDVRVRRALSMTLNRDELLDVASPEGGEWPNIINAGMGARWWLDPRGPDIGDAGKWYQFNVDEAKKLLTEAGFPNGIDVNMHFSSSVYTTIVPYYDLVRQVMGTALARSGIRITEVPAEYGVYITTTFVNGPSEGIAYGLESVFTDVGMYLANMFRPKDAGGGRNHSSVNDPDLVAMIDDMLAQTDPEVLREKNFEIQRYVSDQMYYVPIVTPYEAAARQPWVKGAVNVTGPTTYAVGTEGALTVWLDKQA